MSGYLPMSGRDSIASIASLHGSTDNFSYTSRETLAVLKEKENKSKSCKEMEENLLFESCKISLDFSVVNIVAESHKAGAPP